MDWREVEVLGHLLDGIDLWVEKWKHAASDVHAW